MTNILVEGREQVELADIGLQAERAKKILAKVRKAMLAPNAQMTFFPWKEPKNRVPLAVRHLRTFLSANTPR